MKNLHQKLECSHRLWVKFGGRRRKCKSCGQTWRTYPHKRGRDQKRPIQLFEKYVSGGLPSLFQYAKQKKVSVRTVSFRLEKQRDIFCRKTAWSKIPAGPLIIIADAFIHQIQHEWFTSYLILIRSIDEDRAVILPPYFASGREGILNWYKALDEVPLEVRKRVKALVSDGHRGTVTYAKSSGWVMQRCTFHLISAMQGRRSRRKYSVHRDEGELIYQLTRSILGETGQTKFYQLLSELEALGWQTKSNQLRRIISGFVKSVDDYRAWLTYPELKLPDTSNSAEATIGIFERFHSRSRGFKSVESLTKWITAILKYRQEIFCRPKQKKETENQPN